MLSLIRRGAVRLGALTPRQISGLWTFAFAALCFAAFAMSAPVTAYVAAFWALLFLTIWWRS